MKRTFQENQWVIIIYWLVNIWMCVCNKRRIIYECPLEFRSIIFVSLLIEFRRCRCCWLLMDNEGDIPKAKESRNESCWSLLLDWILCINMASCLCCDHSCKSLVGEKRWSGTDKAKDCTRGWRCIDRGEP